MDEQKIVDRYVNDLVGSVLISREFGISKFKIMNILRKHNVEIRKIRRPDLSSEEMARLYNEGLNTWEIAEVIGTDQTTVRRRLKKFGMILKTAAEQSSEKKKEANCRWTGYKEISGQYWGPTKKAALRRNMEFSVTIEEAWRIFEKQNRKCVLSGEDLYFAETSENLSKGIQNASLDRIDPNRGYSVDNVQWISKEINKMKWNLDQDHFLRMCKYVADHAKRDRT